MNRRTFLTLPALTLLPLHSPYKGPEDPTRVVVTGDWVDVYSTRTGRWIWGSRLDEGTVSLLKAGHEE